MPDEIGYLGWVDDPSAVDAVLESLPNPVWSTTPASATDPATQPEEVLGWRIWEQAAGTPWPELNQGQVGSCVSFGTTHAVMFSMASEIINGDREIVRVPAPEPIYGGSRVEVNNGRAPFRGDGSVGAWAAKWVRTWGIVAQDKYPSVDLSSYSESRAREWGSRGVPTEIETIAKQHPIGDTTLITSFSDACSALASGYGISVCSNRGFSMRRDEDGFCKPSGSWGHCMSFIGMRRTGKRPGLFIVNSWGFSSTTGPKSHPDAPASGWWVDADTADQMLKSRDSWAFSKFAGFPQRDQLDWSF